MSEFPTTKRTGIVFRPGKYGEKGDYSDADIDAMAGDTPLPIRMGHKITSIEAAGKMGCCTRTFAGYDDKGQKVLMGEWDEPLPLTQLLGDFPRTLSIEIEPQTKKPCALALEVFPHIHDARFFSALDDAYAKFSRGEEIQTLDTLIEQEKPMSTETPAATPPEQPKGFMERMAALFSGARPEELDAAHVALTTAKTGKTPREIELEAKVAAFEAAQKNAAFSSIESNAIAVADALVESKHVAAKGNEDYEQAVAAFSAAALADANTEDRAKVACFSEKSPTAKFSLSEHLKAVYAKLPKIDGSEQTNNLTPEQVAVFEQSKTTSTDPATGEAKVLADHATKTMDAKYGDLSHLAGGK